MRLSLVNRALLPAWAWTTIKTAISLLLVSWLMLGFDWSRVLKVLAGISGWAILLWFVIWFTAYCLMALRMRTLLAAQNARIGFLFALNLLFIGAFAGNFLPSSVGGDAAKFVYFARAGYSKSVTGAALILDRLLNILASALFLPFALLVPGLIEVDSDIERQLPYWICGVVLFFGIVLLLVIRTGRQLRRSSVPTEQSSRAYKIAHRGADISANWLNRPSSLGSAMLYSFLAILLMFLDGWILARGLNIDIDLIAWLAIQAGLSALVLLPISLNGLGLQEVSLVYVMAFVGVAEEKSLALALLLRVFVVAFSLLGALGTLTEMKKRSIRRSDVPT